jgi:acetyl esterase/lipase
MAEQTVEKSYERPSKNAPVKSGEFSIRISEPGSVEQDTPLRPAYLNFRGEGWVFGNLATDDPFCRRLCGDVICVCFNVEYRVAPEFKHDVVKKI